MTARPDDPSERANEGQPTEQPLLLDRCLPRYDVVVRAHEVADADRRRVWRTVREFDLMRVRSPLISAAFAVRGLPDRIRSLAGRGPAPEPVGQVTFDEGPPGWVILGEVPGREIAFGAVGVFWTPSIEWKEILPGQFTSFAEPGYGKIAASLGVQPYGARQAIVTYECRVATTDEDSRRRFDRYWGLIRPFVGHLLRATVTTVARDAERRPVAALPEDAESESGGEGGRDAGE